MKKDVIISIKGISYVENDKDVTEFTTVGHYSYQKGKYFLTYEESDLTGMQGTVTNMEIDGENQVVLSRRGGVESVFIVEGKKRHLCQYNTDVGSMMLGISSEFIRNNLTSKGGKLSFRYSLDVNSALASINEVHIHVKECKV